MRVCWLRQARLLYWKTGAGVQKTTCGRRGGGALQVQKENEDDHMSGSSPETAEYLQAQNALRRGYSAYTFFAQISLYVFVFVSFLAGCSTSPVCPCMRLLRGSGAVCGPLLTPLDMILLLPSCLMVQNPAVGRVHPRCVIDTYTTGSQEECYCTVVLVCTE